MKATQFAKVRPKACSISKARPTGTSFRSMTPTIALPTSPLLASTLVRDVPDFPKPGILFKDITPVLSSPAAMREVMDRFIAFAHEALLCETL